MPFQHLYRHCLQKYCFLAALFTYITTCTSSTIAVGQTSNKALPGTKLLKQQGDIASELVAGVDRFLLKQIELAKTNRKKFWKRDFSSVEAYHKSIEPNRKRLAHILGMRDARPKKAAIELVATVDQPALIARGENYEVFAVRWRAFADVYAQGLMLVPKGRKPIANIVALSDCSQTPEMIAGLDEKFPKHLQFARKLAENGVRVVVPVLINRRWKTNTAVTNREWLYRYAAFELGRGLVGYEVQKVLAAVDYFEQTDNKTPIGVIGYGEGGMLAQYAAALDGRIDATVVSGYFSPREKIWQEPIDRNIFGILEQFGDAELAAMILPRSLIVEAAKSPKVQIPGRIAIKTAWHGRTSSASAPATVSTPKFEEVKKELARAEKIIAQLKGNPQIKLVQSENGTGPYGTSKTLQLFLNSLAPKDFPSGKKISDSQSTAKDLRKSFVPQQRHASQLAQLDSHTQAVLRDCHLARKKKILDKLNTTSLAAYEKSTKPLRELFYKEVIGQFELKLLPPNVRTRMIEKNAKWTRYQVVMDVYDDVIAYGLLTIPSDIKKGEKRPVVVCQHGLEGRPESTINLADRTYAGFSTAIANWGFITFAPQNLYIFYDRFRTLQRKGNAIKKTLFSVIVPQHQQITDWLSTLPQVDAKRIGFYGLSYGGKSAMRIPPLVDNYCLSICSADFNEWVDKNASTHNRRSYVNMSEYEIFEFDLGTTFNYAEMAALIAPRPFMVERGHYDGVADDWTVAWEYSKVRNLYSARLKIPQRTEIHWFDGPHAINGKRTYRFLHKHLNWPEPKK